MAQTGAPLYWSDDVEDADWAGAVADPVVVAGAWRAWREEVAFAEQFVAGSLVEEYARYLGHADLLRERIDSRVGQ